MTSTIPALARDFQRASLQLAGQLYTIFEQAGNDFAKDWANNARATSGKHGRLYPNSIIAQSRISTSIIIDVGPDSSKPQGGMGMGFEFGSRNQPAHLDGATALAGAYARMNPALNAAVLQALT